MQGQLFKKPTVWQPGYIHTLPAEDRKLWDKLAFGFFGIDQRAAGISTLVDSRGAPLSGANLTAGSTLEWRATPYGLGVGISGASDLLTQSSFEPISTSDGLGTGEYSYVVLANPIAEARRSVVIGQNVSGARTEFFFNAITGASASGGLMTDGHMTVSSGIFGVAGVVDGGYHLFGYVRRTGTGSLWRDAAVVATGTGTNIDVRGAGTGAFAIGSRTNSTDRVDTACNVVFAAAWNRALSDAEMRRLARDPLRMVRLNRPVVVKAPAAGGGADVRKQLIQAYMRMAA